MNDYSEDIINNLIKSNGAYCASNIDIDCLRCIFYTMFNESVVKCQTKSSGAMNKLAKIFKLKEILSKIK